MKNLTDEELYQRFKSGDGGTDAFEELVSRYESNLAAFINGIVHDYHETKHLTIEAFARLAVGGGRFSGKSTLKTYLFTIGRNLALRYVKMRGKEQHISYEEAAGTIADERRAPHDFVEREETKELVREAMSSLKEEHRAILQYLYFEDMSYIEAGKVMNKSVHQISALARRARIALKRKLESEEVFHI